jgi:hypothetical protein
VVADFQHGLIRLDSTLISVVLISASLAFAAVWMRLGFAISRRVYESLAIGLIATAAIFVCTFARPTWDTSENRGNSFPEPDEHALRQIRTPLEIEVHLAPEDPRRVDLDRRAISKLRRVVPELRVRYISATSIGLFEQTSAGYGEIWYRLDGRSTMSRMTTAEGVLEAIYEIAHIEPPKENDEAVFRGHPLAAPPTGAGVIYYVLWPGLFAASAVLLRRKLA